MEFTDEQRNACEREYRSVERLQTMRGMNAPEFVRLNFEESLEGARESRRKSGVSDKAYRDFCDWYTEVRAAQIVQDAVQDKCLKWLRYLQQGTRREEGASCPCILRYGECSMDCPEFEEATEQQIAAYEHGFEVDTGERLSDSERE